MDGASLLAAGTEALARGAWPEARQKLQQAVVLDPSAEALEALGMACWWLDDQKAVFEARERAYRLYSERGERRSAARVATLIGMDYIDYRSDWAVSSGWLERAESLLRDTAISPEHGWLHLYRGFLSVMFGGDAEEARRRLDKVAELAPELDNVDIAMMSVAMQGLLAIREGRVSEGMRRLDEAMTAAVGGEMSDLAAIGNMSCALIYACEAVADYDRAAQWTERTREFCRRLGMNNFFAICRNYYATVLIWRGAWEEADTELSAALAEMETNRPTYALESLAKLGELRRRQGRVDEAADIFARALPHRTAIFGQASIAFDRGDTEAAIDLLERVLRRVGEEDQAERVFILELLLRARLAAGQQAEASGHLDEIDGVADVLGTQPLRATALASRGVVRFAQGDLEGAKACFEDAIDVFEVSGAHFEAARVRLDYAEVLSGLGRRPAAVEQAMLAQDAFNRLGARLYAQRAGGQVAKYAGDLGAPLQHAKPPNGLSPREAEVLWLIAAGKTNQEIAEDLVLSIRTVERHISTVYEKLGLHGRAARASAAALAVSLRTPASNT